MKHYIEITLLPHAEMGLYALWSRVYQQIHLGLVESQKSEGSDGYVSIGVSFPEYLANDRHAMLGAKLRLFAKDEAELKAFDVPERLDALSDYVHFTKVRAVPETATEFVRVQRYQTKGDAEKLARRFAKRHDVDMDEAQKAYESYERPATHLPYIRMKSLSSQEFFHLYIRQEACDGMGDEGFSSYGLGVGAVPSF